MPDFPIIRELRPDDLPAAWDLSRQAFGGDSVAPPHALEDRPGLTRYGAFDERDRLIGKAVDLHHRQWWGGRLVSAADVGGVAVAPEARGRGVARSLLSTIVHASHERGAAISALYPTTSAPYRSAGWEVTGSLRSVDVPTLALPRLATTGRLSVRAGTTADLPAVDDLYDEVVAQRDGFVVRRGPLFDAPGGGLPGGWDGLTVVEESGVLRGYLGWSRGRGYGADAVLTVDDAYATTTDAAAELIAVLRSWSSVTPTLRLYPVPGDALWTRLPMELARTHHESTWMHRPIDLARAVEQRGWPAHVTGAVTFSMIDPIAAWNTGTWRMEVDAGVGRLTAVRAETSVELTVRGFALLYAGVARSAGVAQAGLASGPSEELAGLDVLTSGQPAQMVDYF